MIKLTIREERELLMAVMALLASCVPAEDRETKILALGHKHQGNELWRDLFGADDFYTHLAQCFGSEDQAFGELIYNLRQMAERKTNEQRSGSVFTSAKNRQRSP